MFEIIMPEKVKEEILELPERLQAKMLDLISKLETKGILTMPDSKSLGKSNPSAKGFFELRVQFSNNVARTIYVYQREQKIILLRAFVKKTDKLSEADLEIAKNRLKELLKNG